MCPDRSVVLTIGFVLVKAACYYDVPTHPPPPPSLPDTHSPVLRVNKSIAEGVHAFTGLDHLISFRLITLASPNMGETRTIS